MTPKLSDKTVSIGSREIPFVEKILKQSELRFYPENPRIHSLVVSDTGELPEQEHIEHQLRKMDHVNQLIQSIKAIGHVLEPLIVRGGDNVVLEGNSRLAALRVLAVKDPIKFGTVKCKVVPADISDDEIFTLLGVYHIVGRKDWQPFEQAGYLWRRKKKHGISPARIASEMGKSEKYITQLIQVYDFMLEHGEKDPQRWSYYLEYFKSRDIQKKRIEFPEMDGIIVGKIKKAEIPTAEDLRDKLPKICKLGGKTFSKLLTKKGSFETCYKSAIARGAENDLFNKLNRFRSYIAAIDFKSKILEMPSAQQSKCMYELKQINHITERALGKFKS